MFLEYRWLNFNIIYYCGTPQSNVSFIIFSSKCTNLRNMKRWLISLYCYTCLFFISLNIYTKYKQRNFQFCLFCRHLYYSSDFIIIMENNFLSRGGQVKKWLTPVVKYSRQANDGGRSSILFLKHSVHRIQDNHLV